MTTPGQEAARRRSPSSILTAVSLIAFALFVGPPVVVSAVPFWSVAQFERGGGMETAELFFGWLVVCCLVGLLSGVAALITAALRREPKGGPLLAVLLNGVPASWLVMARLLL